MLSELPKDTHIAETTGAGVYFGDRRLLMRLRLSNAARCGDIVDGKHQSTNYLYTSSSLLHFKGSVRCCVGSFAPPCSMLKLTPSSLTLSLASISDQHCLIMIPPLLLTRRSMNKDFIGGVSTVLKGVDRKVGQLVAGIVNFLHKFTLKKGLEVFVDYWERPLDQMGSSFHSLADQWYDFLSDHREV
eukprot:TsM_000417000 transcript=TsM_000417000 gene=TsM_000417000